MEEYGNMGKWQNIKWEKKQSMTCKKMRRKLLLSIAYIIFFNKKHICGGCRKCKSRICRVILYLCLIGTVLVCTWYPSITGCNTPFPLKSSTVQTNYTITLRIEITHSRLENLQVNNFISFLIHSPLYIIQTHLLRDPIVLVPEYNELILVRINQPQLHFWKLLDSGLTGSLSQHQHTNSPHVHSIMSSLSCAQLRFS